MAGISALCRIVATAWNLPNLWFYRGRAGVSFFVVVRSAVTVWPPTIQRCNVGNWWTVWRLSTLRCRWWDRAVNLCSSETERSGPPPPTHHRTMLALNSRAKSPSALKAFCKKHNLNHRTFLSINPKTEKSKEVTRILHLAPSTISGQNVCANSGNCAKICLHFAGIPYLMGGKKTCRVRKTLAFFDDTQSFLELTATAILYNRSILTADELLAVRLNGTSDILWETLEFTVSAELSLFWRVKFGIYIVPTVYKSIAHMFAHYPELKIKLYDYTKNRHNWQECKDIGYHLTYSFDGWNNKKNTKLCSEALLNGINVAAAFNIRRGQALPQEIDAARFDLPQSATFTGGVLPVVNGDLTDYRPSDPQIGLIVGLKFKLPHGINYSQDEKLAFCIA